MNAMTVTTDPAGRDPGAMGNDALIKFNGRTLAAVTDPAETHDTYISGLGPRYRDPAAWETLHEGARLPLTVRTCTHVTVGWFVVVVADQDEIVLRHG